MALNPARSTAATTASSATPSSSFTVSSTFCLSNSTLPTPFVFLISALILSAHSAQSAPCTENTCTRSAQEGAAARAISRETKGIVGFIGALDTSIGHSFRPQRLQGRAREDVARAHEADDRGEHD